MDKMCVAAYCRVSTNKRDQLNSFENQTSYFEREVANNPRYELYRIYADKGLSGTSLTKREQFTRMLYDAGLDKINVDGKKEVYVPSDRKPKFQRILVSNSSRFARNMAVIDIIRDLRGKGVIVDFLDKGRTTEKVEDEAWLGFFFMNDQQESVDKSTKVRFGHLEGARKGKIATTRTLYGYNLISEKNELEIIPEEAEVIKKIFELYAQDNGIRKIINILESEGIKTRQGKTFSKSSIGRILENEKYCGVLVRNKYDTGTVFYKNSYAKKRPKSEWILHEGKVPAIITKELFATCQEIREGKTIDTRGVFRGKSEFAGLIVCEQCGANYTRNIDNGRVFFNCSTKKNKGVNHCDNVNLQEIDLEEMLFHFQRGGLRLAFEFDKSDKIQQLEGFIKQMRAEVDQDKSHEAAKLQGELDELYQQRQRLALLYVKGEFELDFLDEEKNKIDEKISGLEERYKKISKTNKDILSEILEVETHIEDLRSLELDREFTRGEIIDLMKTITVEKNPEDETIPLPTFQFKVFDLINRLGEKYSVKTVGKTSYIKVGYDKHGFATHDNVPE